MGTYNDVPFDNDYFIGELGNYVYMENYIRESYYKKGDKLVYYTDSRLNEVENYAIDDKYTPNVTISSEKFINQWGWNLFNKTNKMLRRSVSNTETDKINSRKFV